MKKTKKLYIKIECSFSIDEWGDTIKKDEVLDLVKFTILASNISNFSRKIGLSIIFADNELVRDLNKKYRNKDRETNVISLAANNFLQIDQKEFAIAGEFLMLGDIALAFEFIKDEALRQNKILKNHLIHLIVHSTLHLLGYDHEKEEDAIKMEKLEIDILKKFGINSPYII